jgi:cell division protein FtsZ
MAISSPLLEASIDGAHGVLLCIQSASDIGLDEVNRGASLVSEAVHPEANIIFGQIIDDALADEVRVTVIAAGFDTPEPRSYTSEVKTAAAAPVAPSGAAALAPAPGATSPAPAPLAAVTSAPPLAPAPAVAPAAAVPVAGSTDDQPLSPGPGPFSPVSADSPVRQRIPRAATPVNPLFGDAPRPSAAPTEASDEPTAVVSSGLPLYEEAKRRVRERPAPPPPSKDDIEVPSWLNED